LSAAPTWIGTMTRRHSTSSAWTPSAQSSTAHCTAIGTSWNGISGQGTPSRSSGGAPSSADHIAQPESGKPKKQM
jgi:hypothetical protein